MVLQFPSASSLYAREIRVQVRSQNQRPLQAAMVTRFDSVNRQKDVSDNGYPRTGMNHVAAVDQTQFTGSAGELRIEVSDATQSIRIRRQGFLDQTLVREPGKDWPATLAVELKSAATDAQKAEEKPANAWLGSLDFSEIEKKYPDARKHFHMQCGFCHQQGNLFTRRERPLEEWKSLVSRMVGYGSRVPSDLQKILPQFLHENYARLRNQPSLVHEDTPWESQLSDFQIDQWGLGDSMSQIHDLLLLEDGKILLGDNIQDRIYALDPRTAVFQVHKVPHLDTDSPGGLIAARLSNFPKHDSTSNVHSLALSRKDGHVFITPSAQRRMIEFDPKSGQFETYELQDGFYPHTIRVDQKDRVWFTLALSNQVAMFDRSTKKFTIHDLPARSAKERLTTTLIKPLFWLMNHGIPISKILSIDWQSTGVPLAYGIDIDPQGRAWFARVNAGDIGSVDPETGKIKMYSTPAIGPRRLRIDREGNLWTVHIGASSISKFDPKTEKFEYFPIPVTPSGSETPYALNIDHKRDLIWITGNQSNSIFQFHMKSKKWRMIPMPLKGTFTRDLEIADDGSVYTCISNFPGWHIETGEPRMIRIRDRTLK